jgi:2-polyprenyl-3-methyl-5-hydroxy-6-metoxy-1,4-benzoquinol methylase
MATPYYKERPEVLALVPADSRHVLDVGCGSGLLGSALKRDRAGIEVRGIEPVGAAAAQARNVLDAVYEGLAGDPLPESWPTPDCVVFADALEHMPDPWKLLAAMVRQWPAGTSVVVSLPNVMHHSVLGGLARGRWDYQELGPLDRTHLRFFTRTTAVELIEGAGLVVDALVRVPSYPGPGVFKQLLLGLTWPMRALERRNGVKRKGMSALDPFTYQYLIRARVSAAR